MKNNGGSAFPSCDSNGNGPNGMSLRDWFAGMAMNALLTTSHDPVKGHSELKQQERIAVAAYIIADAMLKEREQNND